MIRRLLLRNDGEYTGDIFEGRANGQGTCIWSHGNGKLEGSRCIGRRNDLRHGKDKMTDANGNVYEGDWKDGNKHGKGVY